jgi:hypothetical protein
MSQSLQTDPTQSKRITVRLSQESFPAFDAILVAKQSGAQAVQSLWRSARARLARGLLDNHIDSADAKILSYHNTSLKPHSRKAQSIRIDLYICGQTIADKFNALSATYLLDASNTVKLVLQANHLYENQISKSTQDTETSPMQDLPAPKPSPSSSAKPLEPLPVEPVSDKAPYNPPRAITRKNPKTDQWEILSRREADTRMTSEQLKEISMHGGLYIPMTQQQLSDHGICNPAESSSPELQATSTPSIEPFAQRAVQTTSSNPAQPPSHATVALVHAGQAESSHQDIVSVEDSLFDSMSNFLQMRQAA